MTIQSQLKPLFALGGKFLNFTEKQLQMQLLGQCLKNVRAVGKSRVQADKILRIWWRQVSQGYLFPFCLQRIRVNELRCAWRLRPVRKFGKCESKLKVLSCQADIRQQGGCNKFSGDVSFRKRKGYF